MWSKKMEKGRVTQKLKIINWSFGIPVFDGNLVQSCSIMQEIWGSNTTVIYY